MLGQPEDQQLQLLPPPPEVQMPEPPVQPLPKSVPDLPKYKNKLQEYTQKSSLQLPVYQTTNEGLQHAPQFRCTVFVDGKSYVSPSTFPQRKLAEQDAAKVALDDLSQKVKVVSYPLICEDTTVSKSMLNEGAVKMRIQKPRYHIVEQEDTLPGLISQDTTFSKSILNEYAVKMRIEKPTYHTVQQDGMLPGFISQVNFNGGSYRGETGRSKKEAEQLAARAAILSILDSDPTKTISKIIESKSKLFAALYKDDSSSSSSVLSAALPAVNTEDSLGAPINKSKEVEVSDTNINLPLLGPPIIKGKEVKVSGTNINLPLGVISQASLDELAIIQPRRVSPHAFKKPRPETPIEEIAPPIVFVPEGSGEVQHPATLLQLQSTSGIKRSRKSKRKAKKRSEIDVQMPTAALPLRQIPPCSVTQ